MPKFNTISISGVQLSSRHDPEREAALQASYIAEFYEFNLYGIGLGYLPEKLLKRTRLRKLNVKVLNFFEFFVYYSLLARRK